MATPDNDAKLWTLDLGLEAKDPLRICLVSAAYRPYPSGVSEHVHHLAEGLRDLGQQVHILTTSYGHHLIPRSLGPSIADSLPVTRFGRAILIPLNRSYATLPVGVRMSGQVKRFLAGGSFDIVQCHGMFWPEISYWAIRHSRSVNVVTFVTAGFEIHTVGSGLFRWAFRNQLAKLRGRIAISRRAREAVEPYVPGAYRIIPSGIDLGRFHAGISPRPERKPGERRILFLGRLDERKGLKVLLQALPAVQKSVPGVRLTVVGSGPMEARARQTAEELGIMASVDFLGPASPDDLPHLYAGCDVYCAPGLGGETLGIVLLEALASGAPVVASRIPGYDETIRDGIDGILVPPGEPDALSSTLVSVLTDESRRRLLAAAGIERAQEYAWPKIAMRTLEFYRELLSDKGSGIPGFRGSG